MKTLLIFSIVCITASQIYCQTDVAEYSSDILPSLFNLIATLLPDALNNTSIVKLAVDTAILTTDIVFDEYLPPPALPELDENIWWGDGDTGTDDTTIYDYAINYDKERIQRLKNKINDRETFVAPLANTNFSYGMDTNVLNDFVERWANEYDFEGRQEYLNQFPQYMTQVQGLNIHYYHIKPQKTSKTVVPLLMLHGFPFSNIEYIHLYSLLSTDSEDYDFVFEIISPSIPGFGYSQGTSKIGLNGYQIAIVLKNLMARLGFEKFYIHAGDFGQIICSDLMTIYPDNVLGTHTNFGHSNLPKTFTKWLIGSLYPPSVVEEQYIDRMYPLSSLLYFVMNSFGYFHEQGTKPDTVGVAALDSPSGLASWIVTLLMDASFQYNYDGETGVIGVMNVTDAYDIITVYWDSRSIVTAMRLYAEWSAWVQDPNQWAIIRIPTKAPLAVSKFVDELIYMPDEFLMDKYPNLVVSKTFDYGNHLISYEYPETFAKLIQDAVQSMIEFNASK